MFPNRLGCCSCLAPKTATCGSVLAPNVTPCSGFPVSEACRPKLAGCIASDEAVTFPKVVDPATPKLNGAAVDVAVAGHGHFAPKLSFPAFPNVLWGRDAGAEPKPVTVVVGAEKEKVGIVETGAVMANGFPEAPEP